jgi:uncharacterized membrane protein YbhN (UPF0104 family)
MPISPSASRTPDPAPVALGAASSEAGSPAAERVVLTTAAPSGPERVELTAAPSGPERVELTAAPSAPERVELTAGRRVPTEGQPEGPALAGNSAPRPLDEHALRKRLITLLLLGLCGLAALLAVPDLQPVLNEITDMNPALVAAAIVLEVASCMSFVVIFRMFFAPVPAPAARELAWSQMGSGALLPGGGIGSLAVGGWLLHLIGMPTRQIVQRSSGLFFLTSAVNVMTLAAGGLVLLLGLGAGPHDVLHAGLPVIVALGAIAMVLGLPRLTRHRAGARARWLEDIGAGIPAARQALARPSWRLAGALGYLLFDIAVLWTTLSAVGPAPPVAPLVVAYLAGYLANAIPVPGGFGVLDAGLVGALTLYGLPVTHAAAAVLVYHAIAFWIPSLGGGVAYSRLRRRRGATSVASPSRG